MAVGRKGHPTTRNRIVAECRPSAVLRRLPRILVGVSDEQTRSRPAGPVVAAVVWAVASAVVFVLLDVVIAAFLCILGLTAVALAFLSSDWVRSTTFEEREAERVRRRKAKWEAGEAARERDRARWEAHQARKAGRTDG
jgi:hypothetical protein